MQHNSNVKPGPYVYEGGDHMIIVGEVIKYRSNDSVEPLVFSRGSYAVAAQHPEMVKSSTPDSNDNDADFVNDYLLYLLREAYQRFSANLYPKLNKQCNVTPEEWRILARMVNASSIEISKLTDMVMQPDINLRETADRMVTKGLIEYQDKDTLKVTVIGQTIAKEMKEIALREEKALLDQLDSGQAKLLKDTLKSIIN